MTDVMQSLTTVVNLLKRLRAANENIKNADFANLIADLNLEFADVKMKLAGVIEENLKLKEQIRVLQAADGDPCPKCRKRTYHLEGSRPIPHLATWAPFDALTSAPIVVSANRSSSLQKVKYKQVEIAPSSDVGRR